MFNLCYRRSVAALVRVNGDWGRASFELHEEKSVLEILFHHNFGEINSNLAKIKFYLFC